MNEVPQGLPPPIAQINQHCCGLACYSYIRSFLGKPISQEELLQKNREWFPKWEKQPGVLSPGDMVNLVAMEGPPYRRLLLTPDWSDVEEAVARFGADRVGAAFVFLKSGGFHSFALLSSTTQQGPDKKVFVMDPDPVRGGLGSVDPRFLSEKTNADFLLFFA